MPRSVNRQWVFSLLFVLILIGLMTLMLLKKPQAYRISLVHINDFYSTFEPKSEDGTACKQQEQCLGGFGRLFTVIELLRPYENFILLNAGNNFQGSILFSLFQSKYLVEFFNMLPFDAFILGVSDFCDSIEGLIPYVKNLQAPVIACNIDTSLHQELEGLYNKSIILTRGPHKIGIIGVIPTYTKFKMRTQRIKFLDEVESVNKEADHLASKNVFTIIVLSSCGYYMDVKLAEQLGPKVSIVVSGGAPLLLYTGEPPKGQTAVGAYPTVVEQSNRVLIVTVPAYTRFVGNLTVVFNEKGHITEWSGNPIFLGASVQEGPFIKRVMDGLVKNVANISHQIIGVLKEGLPNTNCNNKECALGNMFADAIVDAWNGTIWSGAKATIGLINGGSFATGLHVGNITYTDLITTLPSRTYMVCFEIKGKYIKQSLEDSTKAFGKDRGLRLLQVSGLRVAINMIHNPGKRVVLLQVLCQKCNSSKYENLALDDTYRVATTSYLAEGMSGYKYFKLKRQRLELGPPDLDHFVSYFQRNSPIHAKAESRLIVSSY